MKERNLLKMLEHQEVAKHIMEHGHNKTDMELSILGYESNWMKRGIKEAINIRRYKQSLNEDQGRYKLSQIWTDVIAKGNRDIGTD